MEPRSLKYLPQLDGLRAVAIAMVFLHHCMAVPLLWSGVDLFFILSGYLITTNLLVDRATMGFGKMLSGFYIRRAERILPAYVLFLVVAYPFERAAWHRDWPYLVGFLQNIPYALHPDSYNAYMPLWSLAVEQQFYLLWPLLIYLVPRRWLGPFLISLLITIPLLRVLCTPLFATSTPIYALAPFRIDTLAAGALAALLLPGCRVRPTIRAAQIAAAVGALVYFAMAFHHPWFSRTANGRAFNGMAYSLNILVLGGVFVWVTLSRETALVRLLSHPVMRWLGRISYSFYLFHLLVYLEAIQYFEQAAAAAITLAVTLGIATLGWRFIEKPVLSLRASRRRHG